MDFQKQEMLFPQAPLKQAILPCAPVSMKVTVVDFIGHTDTRDTEYSGTKLIQDICRVAGCQHRKFTGYEDTRNTNHRNTIGTNCSRAFTRYRDTRGTSYSTAPLGGTKL